MLRKIDKINALISKLQEYAFSIKNDIYVAPILKQFDDTASEYGDILFISKEDKDSLSEQGIDYLLPLSREELDKIYLSGSVISLCTSFATSYKYGCISESPTSFNPNLKKFGYYITGKLSGSDPLSINDFFIFSKDDIDTSSVVSKSENYFPISSTVSNFLSVSNFITTKFCKDHNTSSICDACADEQLPKQVVDQIAVFNTELSYISSTELREHVECLLNTSHYFNFIKAASSTGKYHPQHELGDGGLVRHTKCVVRFAKEIMRGLPQCDSPSVSDPIIAACILHDMEKYNESNQEHTNNSHPLDMRNRVITYADNINCKPSMYLILHTVAEYIGSHHGRWTEIKSYSGGKPTTIGYMPYPVNDMAWIVHMADLMASRQFVHINFDEQNNIID